MSGLLLERFGWQAVLGFGGVSTIALSVLFVFLLPESLEFLINRGNGRDRAATIIARMAPQLPISASTHLAAGGAAAKEIRLAQLVEEGRGIGTLLIWAGMFMNLMIYFFLQKWLTSLLVQSGLSQQVAITATTVGLAGGIAAALIIGPLMDRYGPYLVVAGLFALSAISVVLMARILAAPVPSIAIIGSILVGFCLSGGQKANNALSVYFYPTALRGTGIGWSLGVGRIGGVLGPFAAGIMLVSGWSPAALFDAAAIPMIIGAVAIAAMGQIYGRAAPVAAAETTLHP